MALKVYGIPTCGTVKKARKWLDENRIDYEWIDLRESPPAPELLDGWVAKFSSKPMKNTSGGAYRGLGPEKKAWDDARWLVEFKTDVMLLKRPIVERDGEPVTVGFKQPVWEELFAK